MTKTATKTKQQQALDMFVANPNIATKDFIAQLMTKLGMSELGARTYAYNCRKLAGVSVSRSTAKAQKAKAVAKPKVSKDEAVAKLKQTETERAKARKQLEADVDAQLADFTPPKFLTK